MTIIYSIVWGLVCSGGKNNTACNILNGCNGLQGLSPGVIAYLVTGKRDAAVEHDTINR